MGIVRRAGLVDGVGVNLIEAEINLTLTLGVDVIARRVI